MLKAKMKDNPDLARISLAVLEKRGRDKNLLTEKKKAVRWKASDGLPGGTFIDAGNACEAFDLVKDQEICESKNDLFENFTKVNAYDQKKILDALSLYFDGKEKNLSGRLLTDKLKAAIVVDYSNAVRECPINDVVIDSLTKLYKDGNGTGNPDHFRNLQVRTYLESKSIKDYIQEILPDLEEVSKREASLGAFSRALVETLQDQEKCATRKLSMKSDNLCLFEADANISRIMNLSALGFSARDLYRFVDYTEDRDEYFNKALHCDGVKHKIPSTLNCSTISLIEMSKKDTYIKDFSDLLTKNLEEDTPIGISVCTRFFTKPNVVTLKPDQTYPCGNKNDPDYQNGEGSHAVTIIGKRCVNGKNQFLIHNSWGTGCGYYAKEYECNKKGGFWVDEEIIAKNARLVNILK